MSYIAQVIEGSILLKSSDPLLKAKVSDILWSQKIDNSPITDVAIGIFPSKVNYEEHEYTKLADLCRTGSFLRFIGEDQTVWTLEFGDGHLEDKTGEILWDHKESGSRSASVPLGDGFSIVAEPNMDSDYKEMFVYLRDDSTGCVHQDLAIIGENYRYVADKDTGEDVPSPVHGSYSVKVYSDPYNEDWQVEYNIDRYEYEKED